MNEAIVKWAISIGAPVTCATCRHFHEGNTHCGKTECGGPGSGRDFPSYDGPIPRDKFAERCLVCGVGDIAFHIVLGPDKTSFALCKKHRRVFDFVGTLDGGIKRPVRLIALP